jgi:uncharacterized protein
MQHNSQSIAVIVRLIVVSLVVLSTNAVAQQTSQCSLAVVTASPDKDHIDSEHICDPATVRSLASHGRVFEQNQMGMVSILAIGTGYDPASAAKWFERAALKGYAPAQVNLAVMYMNGWGVPQNYGVALHWLHEAASQNYARAYYNLGLLYFQGNGVSKNDTEAFRYFQKGADGGDSTAQTNLGYMYDQGLGVKRDLPTAARWYRKAADAGNALAENNLADLYLRGEGVPQDDALAFQLFQKAADQGETGARIKLGYMYSAGRATAKNPQTAYAWVAAAVQAGDDRGRDLLQSLEHQLSPAQLSAAKEQARKLNSESETTVSARSFAP